MQGLEPKRPGIWFVHPLGNMGWFKFFLQIKYIYVRDTMLSKRVATLKAKRTGDVVFGNEWHETSGQLADGFK